MKQFLARLGAMTMSMFLVVSCTLSEKDAPEQEEQQLQLKSISMFGAQLCSFSYDSQNRLIRYHDGLFESTITVKYDGDAPTEIVWEDSDGTTIFNNIRRVSSTGFISSFDEIETYHGQTYTDHLTLDYDVYGHLTSIKYDDGETTTYNWTNQSGKYILESVVEDETTFQQFEYSDVVANKHLQWVTVWGIMGGLEMTGLFGNAPELLISSGVEVDGDDVYSLGFDYRLNTSGYISKVYFKDYEEEITLNFEYTAMSSRSMDDILTPSTGNSPRMHRRFANPFKISNHK